MLRLNGGIDIQHELHPFTESKYPFIQLSALSQVSCVGFGILDVH